MKMWPSMKRVLFTVQISSTAYNPRQESNKVKVIASVICIVLSSYHSNMEANLFSLCCRHIVCLNNSSWNQRNVHKFIALFSVHIVFVLPCLVQSSFVKQLPFPQYVSLEMMCVSMPDLKSSQPKVIRLDLMITKNTFIYLLLGDRHKWNIFLLINPCSLLLWHDWRKHLRGIGRVFSEKHGHIRATWVTCFAQ